jgi:hypothetical protein
MLLTVKYQKMMLALNKYYDILVAYPDKNEIVLQRTFKIGNMLSWFKNVDNDKAMHIVYAYTNSNCVSIEVN